MNLNYIFAGGQILKKNFGVPQNFRNQFTCAVR